MVFRCQDSSSTPCRVPLNDSTAEQIARIFYRIFYRTGRNNLLIHSTVQHGDSQSTSSDTIRWTPANSQKPNL